jgi:hypothetical protein
VGVEVGGQMVAEDEPIGGHPVISEGKRRGGIGRAPAGRTVDVGLEGIAFAAAPEREALPADIALAYSKVLKAPPKPTPVYEPRWTVWGAGFGGSNRTAAISP